MIRPMQIRLPRTNAERGVWLHTIGAVVWALLIIPTLLWWRDSVFWVATMSLYANVVGHWSARQGARAEREADDGS